VFAHVCSGQHLCEAACVLAAKSEPLAIGSLAKFLLAYSREHGISEPPVAPARGQSVAVIGSGLCGLVAADSLSKGGYSVTVIDCHAQPGGRLVNGLPGFKVDRELIQQRDQTLRDRGVHFQMNVACGRDVTLEGLREKFDAVFIGLGRADAVPLNIPGAELEGVHQAYPFVLQSTSNVDLKTPPVSARGRRIVVLGGGETALDAARVALRKGAEEVSCLYRRDENSLPCLPESYRDAREEGVRFLFQVQATSILGAHSGKVTGVRCARTVFEGMEASGRPGVQALPNTKFDIPSDLVLVAYGFTAPKLPPTGDFGQLALDDHGCVKVDANQMSSLAGVFAGGSVVRGRAALADVVRDARTAAHSIDQYLARRRPSRQ
jgi:glutamate synthase (NADPH/NADH) small chain